MLHDFLERDDLEAICSILEDETNKNQLAHDIIVIIDDGRQLNTY